MSAPMGRGVRRRPGLDNLSSVRLFVWQYGSVLPNQYMARDKQMMRFLARFFVRFSVRFLVMFLVRLVERLPLLMKAHVRVLVHQPFEPPGRGPVRNKLA